MINVALSLWTLPFVMIPASGTLATPLSSSPLSSSSDGLPLHTSFVITFAPLSVEQVYHLASDPGNGAVVLMSGTVRNQTGGQSVSHLEYQAYEPMALKVFAQIAHQIRQQWPDVKTVVIQHRIGKLAINEISVLVAVGHPHRAEAFAACQYAIDTLKHQAPIWKKEHWIDGHSEWVSIGSCDLSHS